jgi:hypothetical protein
MNLKTLLLAGLLGLTSLIIAALLAYLTRWQTAMLSLIPLLCGLMGFVLVLLALLAWGLAKARQVASLRRTGNLLLMAGFFLLLQLAYLPISQRLRQQEVVRAQLFVEALVPSLEAYKARQGVYPETFETILSDDPGPPALLQLQGDYPLQFNNRNFYFQREATYGFRFYLPDGFIGHSYEYCCGSEGRWTVTD